MRCAVDGCKGTAHRWMRCRKHGAPPDVIANVLDVYETDGLTAATEWADLSETTVLKWAKQHGRTSNRHRRADPGTGLTGQETARTVGITYRQLDHWTRNGYVEAKVSDPGSGGFRRYLHADLFDLVRLARLVEVGLTVGRLAEMPADERARLLKVLEAEGFAPREEAA